MSREKNLNISAKSVVLFSIPQSNKHLQLFCALRSKIFCIRCCRMIKSPSFYQLAISEEQKLYSLSHIFNMKRRSIAEIAQTRWKHLEKMGDPPSFPNIFVQFGCAGICLQFLTVINENYSI